MSSVIEPTAGEVRRGIDAWLDQFVIGLNLCPFARPLQDSRSLRIEVSEALAPAALHRTFLTELDLLQASTEAEVATTLLVFSRALTEFTDYLDFLASARDLLQAAGLDGLVQLASFHPRYCFGGEPVDSVSHFSNRAPYPVIHFLRESMLTRALATCPHPEQIPENNIRTLEGLGRAEVGRRWRALSTDAADLSAPVKAEPAAGTELPPPRE